ncbi:hypothetical protein [Actinoplanes sp. NPDC051411]|uniref:hypothetical protein n=1 Tax=Actinoplanes sp. NPDC051411 TaxID=3155522 RepID=UPI003423DD04
MAYTPEKPKLTETSDELRARIPGWGADLDPKDRPAVPRERFDPQFGGAHWEFPERQPERWPRERSIEHKFLTPVFGTSCPPRGLSGKIRRFAYAKYSEGRAAHWLLLLGADRVDVLESRLRGLVSGRPDRLIAETGIRAERNASRGPHRTDRIHQAFDPLVVAAPWLLGAAITYAVIRRVTR